MELASKSTTLCYIHHDVEHAISAVAILPTFIAQLIHTGDAQIRHLMCSDWTCSTVLQVRKPNQCMQVQHSTIQLIAETYFHLSPALTKTNNSSILVKKVQVEKKSDQSCFNRLIRDRDTPPHSQQAQSSATASSRPSAAEQLPQLEPY